FPGHPRAFGEPSRISCVVHIGDGEFTDIERKAELGGNIHAKGSGESLVYTPHPYKSPFQKRPRCFTKQQQLQ
ncbi:hypothetical protein E2K67_21015, partial [Escherichia coli]